MKQRDIDPSALTYMEAMGFVHSSFGLSPGGEAVLCEMTHAWDMNFKLATLDHAVRLVECAKGFRKALRAIEARVGVNVAELRKLAVHAYLIGRLTQMFQLSAFEPSVRTGLKVEVGGKKGGGAKRGKFKVDPKLLQAEVERILAENPAKTWADVKAAVARKSFDSRGNPICPRTVGNRTKDPRKK